MRRSRVARSRTRSVAATIAVAIVTCTATTAEARLPVVDESAETPFHAAARRVALAPPRLVGPIDDVAIMGDSLFFERVVDDGRVNTIVPIVRDTLRSTLQRPTLRVRNLSRPGLAIKYPLQNARVSFIALRDWLDTALPAGGNLPDLVVLPATSIDLNLKQSVGVDQLVPELVGELRQIVAAIEARGVQAVVAPAFAINDGLYDGLKSLLNGRAVRCGAAARVSALNRALNASDLPMLFAGFRGLDLDFDGDVDEENFIGFHAGRFPDDGIHTNATGERIIADHISAALIEAITHAR